MTNETLPGGATPAGAAANKFRQLMLLGERLYSAGDLEGARQAFTQAGDLDPKSPEAVGGLAKVLLAEGAYADAKDLYEAAINAGLEKSPENLTNLGICYAFEGNWATARQLSEAALAVDPTYEPAFGVVARQCLTLADFPAADYYASEGLKQYPGNVPCLEARALARLNTLNLDGADADAQAALGIDPSAVDAMVCRASVLLAREKTQDAIQVLLKAHTVEPENVDVLLALGEAFQVSGDLEQADRLFTAAYQLSPLNWRVFQAFSGLEIPRGNAEAGLKAADMAFELKAEAPILHFLRGTHLARLRRLDEARKEFKLATDANPIDCLSWLSLAEIESEDPAENAAAAEHARKALELDSTGRVADRARRVLQKVGKV